MSLTFSDAELHSWSQSVELWVAAGPAGLVGRLEVLPEVAVAG